MIVMVEYRCPECEKRFNCPANLASHRRWHKPRNLPNNNNNNKAIVSPGEEEGGNKHSCGICHKVFRKSQSLTKHMLRLHNNNNNNNNVINNNNNSNSNNNDSTSTDDSMDNTAVNLTLKLVDPNQLICQVCNQDFPTVQLLDSHRTNNHSDTFPCKSCHEIFYSLAGLTRHTNRFHNIKQLN